MMDWFYCSTGSGLEGFRLSEVVAYHARHASGVCVELTATMRGNLVLTLGPEYYAVLTKDLRAYGRHQAERERAYGNSINPWQAAEFIRSVMGMKDAMEGLQ
jgi:hypothetical protein